MTEKGNVLDISTTTTQKSSSDNNMETFTTARNVINQETSTLSGSPTLLGTTTMGSNLTDSGTTMTKKGTIRKFIVLIIVASVTLTLMVLTCLILLILHLKERYRYLRPLKLVK